jgi:hypothetical protein
MLLAERNGVQARDVERFPVLLQVAANEGDVEITRPRSIGIEWRAIGPASARDRAPAKNHLGLGWCHSAEELDEAVESLVVTSERKAHDPLGCGLAAVDQLGSVSRSTFSHRGVTIADGMPSGS